MVWSSQVCGPVTWSSLTEVGLNLPGQWQRSGSVAARRLPTGTELRCSCAWLASRPILSHWGIKKGRLSSKVACLSKLLSDVVLYSEVLTFCCRSNVSRSNFVYWDWAFKRNWSVSGGWARLHCGPAVNSCHGSSGAAGPFRVFSSAALATANHTESDPVSQHSSSTTVGYPSSTAATLSYRNGGYLGAGKPSRPQRSQVTSYPEDAAGIESVTTDVCARPWPCLWEAQQQQDYQLRGWT